MAAAGGGRRGPRRRTVGAALRPVNVAKPALAMVVMVGASTGAARVA
jgi:hypothetical protein